MLNIREEARAVLMLADRWKWRIGFHWHEVVGSFARLALEHGTHAPLLESITILAGCWGPNPLPESVSVTLNRIERN